MRIMQVLTYYPPFAGGIEYSVYNLVQRLKAKNHDVKVITAAEPPTAIADKDVYRLPILFKMKGRWGEVPFCPSIFRLLRTLEADVVHAHMPARLFPDLVTLAEMTKTRKTPVVLHYRLYQDYSSFLMRMLSQAHYSTLGRMTFANSSRIIVPNPLYKDVLERLFPVSSEKIEVVPNAVDDKTFDPDIVCRNVAREKYHVDDKIVVLFVGRLVNHKGVEVLIEAFSRVQSEFPEALLIVAGTGPLEVRLKEMVSKLGLHGKVRFLGVVPQDLMPELYGVGDIFVLPSLFECSSNALREALAMAKPVIATKVGDATKVITNQIDGILVAPGKVEELANALSCLLADKNLALRLGRHGRKTVQERYNWNATVERILEIYSEVIQNNKQGDVN